MAITKETIFNLSLGLLLLQRQVDNAETDNSNEVKVLRNHWPVAWESALEDMDLDSTASPFTLELIAEYPTVDWNYVYKYPTNCAFFRRLKSPVIVDTRETQIPKRIGIWAGQRAIFTNEEDAVAEIITNDLSPALLSSSAALCVAARLAQLASPLIVGKGAEKLRKEIEGKYIVFKADAQEKDRQENFNFDDDATMSEFASTRQS